MTSLSLMWIERADVNAAGKGLGRSDIGGRRLSIPAFECARER